MVICVHGDDNTTNYFTLAHTRGVVNKGAFHETVRIVKEALSSTRTSGILCTIYIILHVF